MGGLFVIVDWIITVAVSVATWFVGLIPQVEVPGWFAGLGDGINSLFGYTHGLAPLVDWPFLGLVVGVPMSIWVGGLLFKLARLVFSHIPLFGGR